MPDTHRFRRITRRPWRATPWACFLLLVVVASATGCGRQAGSAKAAKPPDFLGERGIRYWLEVRKAPRPLRIHHLRIDLANPLVEPAAVLADDPDGDGPATAKLDSPLALARRSNAFALVNANPWQSLPDAEGKRHTDWREALPVQVLGMAISGGRMRNPPTCQCCGFWLDAAGTPHIGNPPDPLLVREGVAGFLRLLDAGRNLHEPKPDDKAHPRTALGLDASSRWLTLVVVDGRQEGFSEGMSCFELAVYMQELGCTDAVNLDGGGSSIMILSDEKGDLRIVNDPCTKENGVSKPRPIPVALVIRPRIPKNVSPLHE